MKSFNYNTSKIKDSEGNWSSLPSLRGESAYELAIRLGTFTGTEEEYNNHIHEKFNEVNNQIESIQSNLKKIYKEVSIDSYDELSACIEKGNPNNTLNVGDELLVNRIKSLDISSNNKNFTFSVTDEQLFINKVGRIDDDDYILLYKNDKWYYLEQPIILSDFGIVIAGTPVDSDIITVKMNYETVSHTFVDFDSNGENATRPKDTNIEHFAIVEETYVPTSFNYDATESAICITVGNTLLSGKYYVYNAAYATDDWWCNYKRLYYTFEIPNDIIATEDTGDIQLRFYSRGDRETTGDARGTYILSCKPYSCNTDALYNNDIVTFTGQINKPSDDYTDFRTIEKFTVDQSLTSEGIIYNNLGHVCYGNNEWNVSNIRQRLNNNDKNMIPKRMHKNDVVSGMKNVKGFMWGLDPRFVKMIKPCIVYAQHGFNDEFTRYELYQCEDRATLLSMKEMSFSWQVNEGQATKLYSLYTNNTLTNSAIASRGKADSVGKTPSNYRWSRSADANYSHYARLVSPSGAGGSNDASYGYRFAAAYIIGAANNL